MTEKRGEGSSTEIEIHSPVRDEPPVDHSASGHQLARTRIRQRWEFASVLNFLNVFKPLVGSDLNISAEEIETALITPNEDLARVHVAILKGIPPVNRNMTNGNAWITVVCKKLASWWQWVAEGENPLNADNGREIQKYKALDPVVRIAILKALCEVRVLQDDATNYISAELKKGAAITTFRKERIGGIGNGVSYWYEGDPVIGHRLYKEIIQIESKLKQKGKGCAEGLASDYQWETLATELEEFQKISDNLSSSNVNAEASLGEIIKIEIVPVLQELQKKKERAWKRHQREVLQLDAFQNYNRVGSTRSCRERRPVRYTFDEYDRSIEEAIQISKKLKTTGSKDKVKQVDQEDETAKADPGSSETDKSHGSLADVKDSKCHDGNEEEDNHEEREEESRYQSGNDDDDDEDYDEKDEDQVEIMEEEEEDNDDCTSSDVEGDSPKRTLNQKYAKTKSAVGLRRSNRFVEPNKGPAETKKRLRQRPTRNSSQIVSDSEDSSQENEKQVEVVSDSEMEDSADSGEESREDASEDSGDASDE